MNNRNNINKREMVSRLESDRQLMPPLNIRVIQSEVQFGTRVADALLQVEWQGKSAKFATEIKASSTPKTLQVAMDKMIAMDLPAGTYPMVIVPYLKEENLVLLEARNVSGMDMCGNGVVRCDNFMVFRSGQPNRYIASSPIKNIYARNSSMVARAFMQRSTFPNVQAILAEVNARNLLVSKYARTPMRQSTVSKCLKSLEEDLIVGRKDGIRLLQADKLLAELAENYRPPIRNSRISCKAPAGTDPMTALSEAAKKTSLPVSLTGLSSVNCYAVMQRGETMQAYCPNITQLFEQSSLVEANRFAEIELFEVSEEPVYFDCRENVAGVWATSPVQTYLELMSGDKRDKETADQVKAFIFSELERRP